MADLTTLRLRLTQAEEALHKIAIGRSVELITEDGSTVRYGKADMNKLELYIASLKNQIADLTADLTLMPRRRGPVQFVF
jgi:gpW protein